MPLSFFERHVYGVLQAVIRIMSADRAAPVMLDFGTSFGDRDAVRDVLNKRLTPAGAASSAPSASGALFSGQSQKILQTNAQPKVDWSSLPAEQRDWRTLLMTKKEVVVLHMKLVGSGIVSDDKFWKELKWKYKQNGQRRGLTAAEIEDFSAIGSEKGVPSSAFDNPAESESARGAQWVGDIPSSAERHIIFMEHPAVSLAYRAKVLDAPASTRMPETAFWSVFKKSSMAHSRLKGTKRAAAVATEADAMFAEFHARRNEVFTANEQKRARTIDNTLNMDRFDDHRQLHVLEGHASSGDAPRDIKRRREGTGSAGESRGLDIMRKLNQHGTMILDGVGRGIPTSWRDEEGARQHPLPDLEEDYSQEYTKLNVDHTNLLQGQGGFRGDRSKSGLDASRDDRQCEGRLRLLQAFGKSSSVSFKNWTPNLTRLLQGFDEGQATLIEILSTVRR